MPEERLADVLALAELVGDPMTNRNWTVYVFPSAPSTKKVTGKEPDCWLVGTRTSKIPVMELYTA